MHHLKALYLPRYCGTSVAIKAAAGKGAARVIAYTASICRRFEYDRVVSMVDTDTDWTDNAKAEARAAGIIVVECEPCLEAVLLHIVGRQGERTTAQHKRAFETVFGMQAHDDRMLRDVYPKQFDRAVLDGARSQVAALHSLLVALSGS
jgi:hypothetical protein